MKRLLACMLLGAALTVPADAQMLRGGTYSVQGTNPDGSRYTGEATIALASDTSCVIEWTIADTVFEGICMLYGDTFAASYVTGDQVGLAIYKLTGGGVLEGAWTFTGVDGAGGEILTRR